MSWPCPLCFRSGCWSDPSFCFHKDHSDENKLGLFTHSWLQQGSQPPSLGFGIDTKAGGGVGKLCNGEKGAPGMPWLEAAAPSLKAGPPLWLARHMYLAFPGPNGKQGQKSGLLRPSEVSDFATPWTVACHTPLSMIFSRQEYCSELPFPSPEGLPDPGIKPTSVDSSVLSHLGSPSCLLLLIAWHCSTYSVWDNSFNLLDNLQQLLL